MLYSTLGKIPMWKQPWNPEFLDANMKLERLLVLLKPWWLKSFLDCKVILNHGLKVNVS